MKLEKHDLNYGDCYWWLRSADIDNYHLIAYIDNDGSIGYDTTEIFSHVNYGYCCICIII